MGGREPDRLVQGPRDDDRDLEGARGGREAVVCASTGNTAASAAAYAARAGLPALILQPAGAVALRQARAGARARGASCVEVRGSFDEALTRRASSPRGARTRSSNSLNPYRIEGQKTAAFEIVEELGAPPDVLALPYGGGGNTRAYVEGFDEAGCGHAAAGRRRVRPPGATTRRSAIRITDPAHREEVEAALGALERRGRRARRRRDRRGVAAARRSEEGVFCEPASAASVAAACTLARESGHRVVCVITGHGLKDPESVARRTPPPLQVDPDPDAIADAVR